MDARIYKRDALIMDGRMYPKLLKKRKKKRMGRRTNMERQSMDGRKKLKKMKITKHKGFLAMGVRNYGQTN